MAVTGSEGAGHRSGTRMIVWIVAMAMAVTILSPLRPAAAEIFGGVDFPQGARSFADEVVTFDPVIKSNQPGSIYLDPGEALGPPDNGAPAPTCTSTDPCYVSLGDGGSITLRFSDNLLTRSYTSANDLWIFEIGPDVEDTFVEISTDGVLWLPTGRVTGSTRGVNIDAFDLGTATEFAYVRLRDDPNEGAQTGVTVGADIDAVGAISTTLVNRPPTAAPDAYTTEEDVALTVPAPGVLGNDTDPDAGDTLTAVLGTPPANGTLDLETDGSFSYTPNPDSSGVDTFTYRASDGAGLLSAEATVTITVTPANDPPTAVPDAYATDEGVGLTVPVPGVLANDTDPDAGDTLTAEVTSPPANGTLDLDADGSFSYTPNPSWSGIDTFSYRAQDGDGALSADAVVTITVSPAPPSGPPQISIDDTAVTEGNSGTTNLVFPVRRIGDLSGETTFLYVTHDGTAKAAQGDFRPVSSVVMGTFPPGVATIFVSVVVNGDRRIEADETLTVVLSAPTNGILVDPEGTGIITNDDGGHH